MKIKKALLTVPLSLSLLAPVSSAFAETPDVPVQSQADQHQSDQAKLATSKAMNPKEEQKKLRELGLEGKSFKLEEGKPLVLNFDDGSKIEYSVTVESTPAERLPVAETTTAPTYSTYFYSSVVYKTYKVSKQYFYGVANANTALYTDVKHDGRYVYVRDNHPYFQGTFARNDYQKTSTIDGTGYNTDLATTELKGSLTLYAIASVADYYTRTYCYRMDIDPAGASYLRVIY